MMRWTFLWALCLAVAFSGQAQQVKLVGADGNTLQDLAGSDTLVTVVLKDSGAKDMNLHVTEVHPTYFKVIGKKGGEVPYLYESVAEVQVQGKVVPVKKSVLENSSVLTAEQRTIVDRAWTRVEEIFAQETEAQELRMTAAMFLAADKRNEDALKYLKLLSESNDLETQLNACFALYIVGEEVPQELIRLGLESGSRTVRAQAAILSGLTGYRDAIPVINAMLQDRASELSAPAARALIKLNNREIIPKLMEMLGGLNEEKAHIAILGLVTFGGEEITETLRLRAEEAEGMEWFRLAQALYRLGDPQGKKMLLQAFKEFPTLQPKAALFLGREEEYEATQYLRQRLARRENETVPNHIYRACNAASLFESGDPAALAVFQKLLAESESGVKVVVCSLVAELNNRRLLTVLQSVIENVDTEVSLAASWAAIALSLPELRERFLEARDNGTSPCLDSRTCTGCSFSLFNL